MATPTSAASAASSTSASPQPMWSSVPPSTAPSTPPPDDHDSPDSLKREDTDADPFMAPTSASSEPDPEENLTDDKLTRLQAILDKSMTYASQLQLQMDAFRGRGRKREEKRPAKKARRGRKSKAAKAKEEEVKEEETEVAVEQPQLVTGGKLKDYQLEGLAWMVGLHNQGISGILADEMGLGKTLQTIAFTAWLRENITRPILIVCPLSVMHNWVSEYTKFAPKIPVMMYHGTPDDRKQMRKDNLTLPHDYPPPEKDTEPESTPTKNKGGKGKGKGKAKAAPAKSASKSRKRKAPGDDLPQAERDEEMEARHDAHFKAFPVVVTTYDLIIKDRKYLEKIPWGYIVVDEGHRLKNMNCALMREIKRFSSGGRMVLTGTPLHNNLAELWSLLNFILPDIFSDLDAFQEWFSMPRMTAQLGSERMGEFISTLHTILKPFLLRRVKADVLGNTLPPKKNYVLYAKLSAAQREAYEAVLGGHLKQWVAAGHSLAAPEQKALDRISDETMEEGAEVDVDSPRKLRGRKSVLAAEMTEEEMREERERRRAEEVAAYVRKGIAKTVNNMHLQNTVMQLRKVCSHPFLFARGDDDQWSLAQRLTPDELVAREKELLGASGKMLLLDRLLGELFRRGHKVLLFSQFTTMLDIIEDWAVDMKGWTICRIDGSTPPLERRDQMDIFQNGGDKPGAPKLFLLSTRSGGLGVNLTAADTVIFYDQDWNPQMDIQAQDRAHRIGQTKPVLIFRLVTAHTVEEKIMQRAGEKRKLEALVIAKGKFKTASAVGGGGAGGARQAFSTAEMAAELLRLDAEDVLHAGDELLSDADMDALLDRSKEVFEGRGEGWTSKAKDGMGKEHAFEVFEPAVDASGEGMGVGVGLEGIMGEAEEESEESDEPSGTDEDD
ncbi:SNF2 family DNA-dependent ATPase [Mycena kentingensis (nom. inval.)]|nr:SNF2 family DNA-dependent ATPase [Mycena kentingensis (nom. inval.)]